MDSVSERKPKVGETFDNVPIEAELAHAAVKIAYTIPQAVQASGLSRSSLYLAIASGALRARKYGARTLILDTDLRRFLGDLPHLAKTKAPSGDRGANPDTTLHGTGGTP
jgi:hypothetical protein